MKVLSLYNGCLLSVFFVGLNEYLCINKGVDQDVCFVGRLIHNDSGRVLEIYSNQRCVCFTTANNFGTGRFRTLQEIKTYKPIEETSTSYKPERESVGDDYINFINAVHNRLEEHLQEDKENNYSDLRHLVIKMGQQYKQEYVVTPNNTPTNEKEVTRLSDPGGVMGLVLTERQKQYLKG